MDLVHRVLLTAYCQVVLAEILSEVVESQFLGGALNSNAHYACYSALKHFKKHHQ